MSEALGDILSGRAKSAEPPEFDTIKRFVIKKFGVKPSLSLRHNSIVISMPNSAAAGSLRLELPKLQSELPSKPKLVIRIGQ